MTTLPPELVVRHPAKYSDAVYDAIKAICEGWAISEAGRDGRTFTILDPFAGTGRIHRIGEENDWFTTWGVELEPEWAIQHPRTVVGDATKLPFGDETVDIIATSPCLDQSQRVLTEDLRWMPVGDMQVGDRILAFDEDRGSTPSGMGSRRRFQRAEIVRSVPRSVECVRVVLANGDEVITTPEHPWLANRYSHGSRRAEWVPSRDLLDRGRWVMRQFDPWTSIRTYDAGWLAGMFDGEGSITMGVHGAPKMTLCQVEGPVLDRVEQLMTDFGYAPNRIMRTGIPSHRQKIGNLYVTGGFPGILRALGELRPQRLLAKWEHDLDLTGRTVEAKKVEVVAVEPAGRRDIQEIETTSGTYFGEGYLHHNCYGNRMADTYDGRDGSRRMTYRLALGRELTAGSAAGMQWGPSYRRLHQDAIYEMLRVLCLDGLGIINMSNHIRGGEPQLVVEWWTRTLIDTGIQLISVTPVVTDRYRHGANYDLRVEAEHLITFRKISPHDRTLF